MRGYDRPMGRMNLLVSTLVVLAVATSLIGVALLMGILSLGPGTGAPATSRPPATQQATLPPQATVELPTAEPPTAAPTVRPTAGGTHVVAPGETLSTIGELYGVPWLLIAEINDIPEPYVIHVGQEILIPEADAQPSAETGIHIVRSGESIISIAELYGVDPTDLADANDIADWNLIFVGQRLVIPDGSATPAPEASPAE